FRVTHSEFSRMTTMMMITAWPNRTNNTSTLPPKLKFTAGGRNNSFFPNPAVLQRKPTSVRVSAVTQEKDLRKPRPQNVAGEFYVDHTCINCDTCRWMAPSTFSEVTNMSAVYNQPTTPEERLHALQALISCPTRSIHTRTPPSDILQVHKTLPIPIDEEKLPGIYHCGHQSEKSYGAASYLLLHPQGNILIDSPRYSSVLKGNIMAMGGVRYMFLTHRDDVADHQLWADALNCERIIHSLEVQETTTTVETKLEGEGPWKLYDDVDLIFTPGHTEGSVCLLHKTSKVLFSGDHLLMHENKLSIEEDYNWYSVPLQLQSVKILLDLDFLWILPGHGRRVSYKEVDEKNSALKAFLESKNFVN
ncbi:MBL fold metallo-hydrolase, partial [Escherichia albertii]|uniref:MBL fold metallo-hydrolase n=1 Tax=Escherichia albertii TaxID=208962 RepID=UPI003F477290